MKRREREIERETFDKKKGGKREIQPIKHVNPYKAPHKENRTAINKRLGSEKLTRCSTLIHTKPNNAAHTAPTIDLFQRASSDQRDESEFLKEV